EFTSLYHLTNDPKVVRVVLRSYFETRRAVQIIADLDRAYQVLKDSAANPEQKSFAAEKSRAIAEILRAEPKWTDDVLRAAGDDLKPGTSRAHQTWHALGLLAARHRRLDLAAVQFRQSLGTAPLEY